MNGKSSARVWRVASVSRTRSSRLGIEVLEPRAMLAITVNTLADTFDGHIDDGSISLRDAIYVASSGDTILFQSGLSGGTLLIDSTLDDGDHDLDLVAEPGSDPAYSIDTADIDIRKSLVVDAMGLQITIDGTDSNHNDVRTRTPADVPGRNRSPLEMINTIGRKEDQDAADEALSAFGIDEGTLVFSV